MQLIFTRLLLPSTVIFMAFKQDRHKVYPDISVRLGVLNLLGFLPIFKNHFILNEFFGVFSYFCYLTAFYFTFFLTIKYFSELFCKY